MRKLTPHRARLARLGDAALAPLAAARRLRRPARRAPIERILAIELWHLGDLVLATPALQALRAGFPSAHITLLAAPVAEDLLRHQDVVDEILPWRAPWIDHGVAPVGPGRLAGWRELRALGRRLAARRFDAAVDFRGDFRDNAILWLSRAPRRVGFDFAGGGALLTDVVPCHPDRHLADQALDAVRALGAPAQRPDVRLWIHPEEAARTARWLAARGLPRDGRPLVALHPGARWEGRRWQPERFARVGDALAREHGARLLLLGGPGDAGLVHAIERTLASAAVAATPSLRELVALCAAADLVIGSDSGPVHVASAVGTPVVALFGPQRPEWCAPRGPGSAVAIAPIPCRPCDQTVCLRPGDSCMQRLDVEAVLAPARRVLRARAEHGRLRTARAGSGSRGLQTRPETRPEAGWDPRTGGAGDPGQ